MKLQVIVDDEEIQQHIQSHVNEFVNGKIKRDIENKFALLFADKHEQSRIKNNIAVNGNFLRHIDYNITDLGILYNIVDGAICDLMFSDEIKNKIKDMVSAKLEKYLEEATDKAAKHLANKLTFNKVNKS